MKIRNKHKISFEQADRLIEKYYDGLTNTEEESKIRTFLSQANLPQKYQPEQAIFGYFGKKKQQPRFRFNKIINWSIAAAAVLILALNIHYFSQGANSNYAFVDGVRITNKHELKNMALASLGEMHGDNDIIEKYFKNLNNNELKTQLEVFATLGKE